MQEPWYFWCAQSSGCVFVYAVPQHFSICSATTLQHLFPYLIRRWPVSYHIQQAIAAYAAGNQAMYTFHYTWVGRYNERGGMFHFVDLSINLPCGTPWFSGQPGRRPPNLPAGAQTPAWWPYTWLSNQPMTFVWPLTAALFDCEGSVYISRIHCRNAAHTGFCWRLEACISFDGCPDMMDALARSLGFGIVNGDDLVFSSHHALQQLWLYVINPYCIIAHQRFWFYYIYAMNSRAYRHNMSHPPLTKSNTNPARYWKALWPIWADPLWPWSK